MANLVGDFSSAAFTFTDDVYPNSDGEFYLTYTAAASGVADTFHFYLNDWWTSGSVKLRLRDASGNLLDETTLTTAAGTGLITGALSAAANITAGQSYILGYICNSGNIKPYNDNNNSILERQAASTYTTAQDPLVAGSTITKGRPQMFVSGAAAGASISSADDVKLGTTTNYTRSGWTESATGATFTTGTSVLTATSVTNTTITWPALANGLNVAQLGAGTLEVTGATESATIAVDHIAPTGYSSVTLAGTLNLTDTGYLFNYGGTPVVGDQVLSEANLLANGDIGENPSGTYQSYFLDVSDAQIQLEAFNVIIGEISGSSGCANVGLTNSIRIGL